MQAATQRRETIADLNSHLFYAILRKEPQITGDLPVYPSPPETPCYKKNRSICWYDTPWLAIWNQFGWVLARSTSKLTWPPYWQETIFFDSFEKLTVTSPSIEHFNTNQEDGSIAQTSPRLGERLSVQLEPLLNSPSTRREYSERGTLTNSMLKKFHLKI